MSATPTPRTEEVLRKKAASEQTPQEDYEALAVHAEMLERELSAERALADRLAAPLFFNEHEALAGEDLEWTPAHVAAVAAYKEARHDP